MKPVLWLLLFIVTNNNLILGNPKFIGSELKIANNRQLLDSQMIFAIKDEDDHNTLAHVRAASDQHKNMELNIGAITRQIFCTKDCKRYALGVGAYLNSKKTYYKNVFHELSLNFHISTILFDIVTNVYLPMTKEQNIKKGFNLEIGDIRNTVGQRQNIEKTAYYEKSLGGFDIRLVFKNIHENLRVIPTIYRFKGGGRYKNINGAGVKAEYNLNRTFKISAEYLYDKVRKHMFYIGFGFNLPINSDFKYENATNSLLYAPIYKDMDIVTAIR